jgi:cell wall-associated NlpC family hydrolase
VEPSARISVRARIAVGVTLVVALAAATPGAGAPPALKKKEAEAQRILGEVQALDVQLGRLGEQLNGARYELGGIRARERRNAAALATARRQYAVAEHRLEARVVAIYESEPPTTVDAILGATSLSGVLDRIELINAASALDRRIARQAAGLRAKLALRARELTAERSQQAIVVESLAAHQHALDSALGERRTLLSSVQGEVHRLQVQEAATQARLAAAARARLAAEAAQRARLARVARLARAKAKATPPAAPPAPATTVPTTTTTSTATPAPADPAATTTDATTTTAQTVPAPPPPAPSTAGPGHPEAASIGLQYLGVPYVFGGSTPAGFDCSGFVMYVYAKLGISLPHFAAAQYTYGTAVARSDLQPGDLVFFDGLNHVGISLGGNEFVDAPHTGDVVKIESIVGWYADRYVGARRL